MHKNYRFSKKQEGTVLITVRVNYVNLLNNPNVNPKNEDACKKTCADLKVQFDSGKKHSCMPRPFFKLHQR